MSETYWSQPNQQVVRDGDPVGVVDPGPDPQTSGAFDPGEHTVADVQAYVDANPDQAQAVYDAESEGKQRTTLLEWLTAEG